MAVIALVGNPNVGKSIFFNYLTGNYVEVSNFPGTTVDISSGKLGEHLIIDTPGVYRISSSNDEEKVTKKVILDADMIINVVDANNLERDLFLTLQLLDMGKPMVIALNMMDEAKKNGRKIDIEGLSGYLGVEVIPTIAVKQVGLDKVKRTLTLGKIGKLDQKKPSIQEGILILEEDPEMFKKYKTSSKNLREDYYLYRRERVNKICSKVVTDIKTREIEGNFSEKLNYLLIHPLYGFIILISVLAVVYGFIGKLISGYVVDFTEGYLMEELLIPGLIKLISIWVTPQSLIGNLLLGEFGLFTLTIKYLFGLLLPLVVSFYFVMSLMEDSGYLPRVAVLLDKYLSKIGLNGKGIIPIILGFGCVTMATITTRILGTQKERTIATILLAISIPCSAQMAVILSLLSSLGGYYITIYFLTMIFIFIIVGKLTSLLLPGKSNPLLLDIPNLRFPKMKNVFKKTYYKTLNFLQDALPLFAIGAMLIGGLNYFTVLDRFQNYLSPLTVNWLKLPKETANIFIMGLIRRDFGTAGLIGLTLTLEQTLISLVTITLFVPCIASIMVILKERGIITGVITVLLSISIAFFTGGLLARLLL
ncbi:ferrous iron transport protein B [Anaerobranca californiensis DSM 14826]|jgi:ferrous iron transport protein B|uniref:Ferrous iron transport protein B n=1 Tax=Anaerobranca californiensis DSM 14826 TaxID=1120989 RepID=A0A1M6MHC8_9FIRM|nr:ferrous iron transport protein B [Anaerobranca californiensis]SHJ82929.1 ferrous iron transport protein B [Anaerobranca californiensis DSM 14826]